MSSQTTNASIESPSDEPMDQDVMEEMTEEQKNAFILENRDRFRLPTWQEQIIENIFERGMSEIDMDTEIQDLQNEIADYDEWAAEEQAEIEAIDAKIAEAENESAQLKEILKKAKATNTIISEKQEQLQNQIVLHMEPRLERETKITESLIKKFQKLAELRARIGEDCQVKLEEQVAQLNEWKTEERNWQIEDENVQRELDQQEQILKSLEQQSEALGVELAKAKEISNKIKQIEESEARLVSAIEIETAALSARKKSANELEEFVKQLQGRLNEAESQKLAGETENLSLTTRRAEVASLVEFLQKNSDIEEIEANEVFQREFMNSEMYVDFKKSFAETMSDNRILMDDLEKQSKIVEEKSELVEQRKRDLELLGLELTGANNEIANSKRELEGLLKVLEAKEVEAQKTEEKDMKEIQRLKAELKKRESAFNLKQSEDEMKLAVLAQNLQDEKDKTLKAKQAAKGVASRRSSVVSLEMEKMSDSIMYSPLSMTLTKQNVQRLSENLEKKEAEEVKVARISKFDLSKHPLAHSAPLLQEKRSRSIASSAQAMQTRRSDPNPKVSPPASQLASSKTAPKRKHEELKENKHPEIGTPEVKRARESDEEEKAFDSDDSDEFNFTFNTEIDSSLQ